LGCGTKSNSKPLRVVGQIAKLIKIILGEVLGSPTPYPESPGVGGVDEFAKRLGLKRVDLFG
jgi:hypothetical protein